MAVIKNAGSVPDIDESKLTEENVGFVDEVIRKASATKVDVKETEAYEEGEAKRIQGAANQAKYDEAGKVELAKGSAEGQVVTEALSKVAPAAGIAANLMESVQERASNPSKNRGAADAVKAGLLGKGGQSFEDGFKAMKKASVTKIETARGRSLSEKGGALSASMKSLVKDTKGMKESGVGAGDLSQGTGNVKKTMEITSAPANEAKLAKAMEIKRDAAPAPSGVGAPALKHDSMAQGPKGPSHMDVDEESWV